MKHSCARSLVAFALLALCFARSAGAVVKPNGLFTTGAVLQQGIDVPVWGTAKDGEKVTVRFEGQEVSTVAEDGRWMVKLKPLKPGGPFVMTFAGENKIEIKDVLVGEVWLCKGQSNMAFPLSSATNGKEAAAGADDPQLRFCHVPKEGKAQPQSDVRAQWKPSTPESAALFSAMGYYFGRDLRKTLKVPVGLIGVSVGGTGASEWISAKEQTGNPIFREFIEKHDALLRKYPADLEKYKAEEPKLLEEWKQAAEKAKQEGKPAPSKPAPPGNPANRGPGALYNSMIAPLQPYAIRGAICSHGGADSQHPVLYRDIFATWIKTWRHAWGQGDLPFIFVQASGFKSLPPELRETQLKVWQQTPATAMVVSTDCGEKEEIHYKLKEPVGDRLALAARELAYGEKIESSGPVFDAMTIDGGRAVLAFKHVGGGLVARDGELKGFTIAGADMKFVAATAKIENDKVVVTSDAVAKPVAVRYGWANVPEVTLFNKEGLPASPFRTDQ